MEYISFDRRFGFVILNNAEVVVPIPTLVQLSIICELPRSVALVNFAT